MNGKDLPYGVGVLVVKNGKFLCGLRSDNLEICGPGGHVEKGENAEQAARREAKEEFNITPKNLIPLGVISDENDAFKPAMIFVCMDYEGEPKADGEEIRTEGFGFNDISEIKRQGGRISPAFDASIRLLTNKLINTDGGSGSGNWGHSGRPGQPGGSASGGGKQNRLSTPDGGYASLSGAYKENEKRNKEKKKETEGETRIPTKEELAKIKDDAHNAWLKVEEARKKAEKEVKEYVKNHREYDCAKSLWESQDRWEKNYEEGKRVLDACSDGEAMIKDPSSIPLKNYTYHEYSMACQLYGDIWADYTHDPKNYLEPNEIGPELARRRKEYPGIIKKGEEDIEKIEDQVVPAQKEWNKLDTKYQRAMAAADKDYWWNQMDDPKINEWYKDSANYDGGHGSGNFGHSGRPGKRGGSGGGGGLDAKLAGYVKSMNPEERKMYDEAVAKSDKAKANVDKFMKANKESWNDAKTAVANGKTPITGTEAAKDHTIKGGSAEAQAIYDKARAAEPEISKDLIGIASSQGNEMYGLAYSVKTGESMADKIARKQKDHPNDSDVKIVGKMGDMVRYTELTKHDSIAQTTQKTVLDLKNKGYKITEIDNKYLDKNSDYKGVHVSAVKDGQVFELQIHSEESMRVKERLHPMYETSRKVDTPPLVTKALQTKMKQISQTLPTPKGIDQVKSFKE